MFPELFTPQIAWNPQSADRVLLAGDETSIDTIAMILASLPASARGQVFIEVDTAVDIRGL
jgi:NADPH-dependent ferric siderophore reductase